MRYIQLGDRAFKVLFIFTVAFLTVSPFVVAWEFKQMESEIAYVNGTVIHQVYGKLGLTTTTVQLDNGTTITFQGCNSDLHVGERVSVPFLDGMNLWEECFV